MHIFSKQKIKSINIACLKSATAASNLDSRKQEANVLAMSYQYEYLSKIVTKFVIKFFIIIIIGSSHCRRSSRSSSRVVHSVHFEMRISNILISIFKWEKLIN